MDKYSFIIYIKTEDVFKDIANHVERRFNASKYGTDRRLQKEINKNINWLKNDKLGFINNDTYC